MSAAPLNQTWTGTADTRILVITIKRIARLVTKEVKMVTNEERREVARKLREADEKYPSQDCTLGKCAIGIKTCPEYGDLDEYGQCDKCFRETLDRLADLIEPEPERTCEWHQDENGLYHTSCGEIYETIAGTREENGIMFCPYCGREVVD